MHPHMLTHVWSQLDMRAVNLGAWCCPRFPRKLPPWGQHSAPDWPWGHAQAIRTHRPCSAHPQGTAPPLFLGFLTNTTDAGAPAGLLEGAERLSRVFASWVSHTAWPVTGTAPHSTPALGGQ